MIKTPAEIELLERAATTTRRAVEAAFAAAQPGDTEKKVANNIVYHLFDQGCDETAFITLAAAKNGSRAHHLPDATRLERGQIVRTDLGGYFTGYYSDLARTYVVGEPSREQADTYRKLRRIYSTLTVASRSRSRYQNREITSTCAPRWTCWWRSRIAPKSATRATPGIQPR